MRVFLLVKTKIMFASSKDNNDIILYKIFKFFKRKLSDDVTK